MTAKRCLEMSWTPILTSQLSWASIRVEFISSPQRTAEPIGSLSLWSSGNRHEAVADRLNFVEPMLGGDALENDKERIEPRHHVFRLMLVAIGGEIGHVAEQDRDILVDWVRLWRHLSARTASGARLNCFGNGSEGAGRPSSMDMAN